MANRSRSSGQRQAKLWTATGSSVQAMTATNTFSLASAVNFSVPQTILRMLGEYVITPTAGGTLY